MKITIPNLGTFHLGFERDLQRRLKQHKSELWRDFLNEHNAAATAQRLGFTTQQVNSVWDPWLSQMRQSVARLERVSEERAQLRAEQS